MQYVGGGWDTVGLGNGSSCRESCTSHEGEKPRLCMLCCGCDDPGGSGLYCSLSDVILADVMGWVDVVQIWWQDTHTLSLSLPRWTVAVGASILLPTPIQWPSTNAPVKLGFIWVFQRNSAWVVCGGHALVCVCVWASIFRASIQPPPHTPPVSVFVQWSSFSVWSVRTWVFRLTVFSSGLEEWESTEKKDQAKEHFPVAKTS